MNLKRKLNLRVTAIVRIIDATTAIVSDESSDNEACPLHLVSSKNDVLKAALELAVECNKDTRFDHKILVFDAENKCTPYVRKKEHSVVTF